MTITVDVEDESWQALEGLALLAEAAALAALEGKAGDIALLFTSDEEVRALNKEWRGQDKATNVLSFPNLDEAPTPPGEAPHLGDIAMAHGTMAREAAEQGKTLAAHTQHLIVHGVLHILGYDHDHDDDAETMENRERQVLAGLGVSDPYAA